MAGQSIELVARTFHTVNGVAHAEGDRYTVTDRALAETLRGIGFVSIAAWPDAPPAGSPPTVTSLAPASAVLGSPSFTLHVMGANFAPDAVIVFAEYDEPTTRVSDTELTTGVNMAVWLGPDVVAVAVRSGGVVSAPVSFTFTAP